MKVTPEQVERLLRENHVFTQFGFAMLVGRLKVVYAKNSSQEVLQELTDEVNRFLKKFEDTMANDYEVIESLGGEGTE